MKEIKIGGGTIIEDGFIKKSFIFVSDEAPEEAIQYAKDTILALSKSNSVKSKIGRALIKIGRNILN
jgi:hypothetical protein